MSHPPPTPGTSPRTERVFFDGGASLIKLTEHADKRGCLLALDHANLPFEPQRTFATHAVPVGTRRGGHAHRYGWQLLIRLTGRINVAMRRGRQHDCLLQHSDTGLLIGPGIWSEQTYLEPGSTLLVIASTPYDPASYIHGSG